MAAYKHIHGRQLGAFGSLTYRSHAPCPPACMQLRMPRPRRGDQRPIPARRPASTSGAASAALPAMQHGRAQTRHPHIRAAGGATSSRVRQRTGQRPGADLQGPDLRGARRGSRTRQLGSRPGSARPCLAAAGNPWTAHAQVRSPRVLHANRARAALPTAQQRADGSRRAPRGSARRRNGSQDGPSAYSGAAQVP